MTTVGGLRECGPPRPMEIEPDAHGGKLGFCEAVTVAPGIEDIEQVIASYSAALTIYTEAIGAAANPTLTPAQRVSRLRETQPLWDDIVAIQEKIDQFPSITL